MIGLFSEANFKGLWLFKEFWRRIFGVCFGGFVGKVERGDGFKNRPVSVDQVVSWTGYLVGGRII